MTCGGLRGAGLPGLLLALENGVTPVGSLGPGRRGGGRRLLCGVAFRTGRCLLLISPCLAWAWLRLRHLLKLLVDLPDAVLGLGELTSLREGLTDAGASVADLTARAVDAGEGVGFAVIEPG